MSSFQAANRCDIKSIVACCDQQDMLIAKMLNELATLQDRAHVKYAHAPYHRKRTKRLVCGLHEVVKHLKLRNLHLVILASNLEGRATDDFIVSKSEF